MKQSYYDDNGNIKQVIYVDHDMKICDKKTSATRVARYNAEFDLYVIDVPKYERHKEIDWNDKESKIAQPEAP